MKRVFSSLNVAMVKHLKNVLENNGIECVVKGEFLSGAMGEIPLTEAWSELWVVDDARNDEATKLLRDGIPDEAMRDPWSCRCGEESGGQFTECWSCGTRRPDLDQGAQA